MFLTRDGCPACGEAGRTLYSCPFNADPISSFLEFYYHRELDLQGEYRAVECNRCGTIFQAEVGDDAFLAILYGEWIDSIDPEDDPQYRFDIANPRLSRDGHEIICAAAFLDVPLAQMVTLDFGMGWASWARNARELGCKSHGYDLSPERFTFAQKYGIITDLDETFHFINTEQVIEHVPRPAALVADLAARLRPGGILKISVPSNLGLKETFARLAAGQPSVTRDEIMPLQPLEHLNCFTPKGLELMSGMTIVWPSLVDRFAFLPSGISLRYPRKAVKELVRPFWRNRANVYVWLQRR
jgi:SAM-dependent methyltransferase